MGKIPFIFKRNIVPPGYLGPVSAYTVCQCFDKTEYSFLEDACFELYLMDGFFSTCS